MSRRSKPAKRIPAPDPIYNSVDIAKFINRLMKRGKKSIAQRIFYSSMDKIQEKTKENPIDVFKKALTNATPLIEVKARRIGGSTYQVPVEVKPDRGQALGSCWLIESARKRSGKSMIEKLTNEIMDASNGIGASCKKREDTHKMAEANKAFAHYRY
ncbi:TPA: 30S ribosomal protein S7 [Candidatus Galligastranaerophilus gallistercoris]|nr:30S ribosomal protein S7 [Candidatus Galligastranaerophilus gallistercoris]